MHDLYPSAGQRAFCACYMGKPESLPVRGLRHVVAPSPRFALLTDPLPGRGEGGFPEPRRIFVSLRPLRRVEGSRGAVWEARRLNPSAGSSIKGGWRPSLPDGEIGSHEVVSTDQTIANAHRPHCNSHTRIADRGRSFQDGRIHRREGNLSADG